MRVGFRATIACVAFLAIAAVLRAEQITSSCRITAVDAGQRKVTLVRKTATGEREGVAKVVQDAAVTIDGESTSLEKLKIPAEVIVVYDTDLKAVTSISTATTTPPPNAPAAFPTELRGHTGGIVSLAISPKGDFIASAGGNLLDARREPMANSEDRVRIWPLKAEAARLADSILAVPGPSALAISPDGTTLGVTDRQDATLRLYDVSVSPPALRAKLAGLSGFVLTIAFSPDSKMVAAASRSTGDVRVWDLESKNPAGICLPGSAGREVHAVAFGPNSKTLAVAVYISDPAASHRGEIVLWSLEGSKPRSRRVLSRSGLGDRWLAYTPNERYLLAASYDGFVRIWDITTQTLSGMFAGHRTKGLISCVAVSPDSRLAASCDWAATPTVRIWSIKTQKEILAIPQEKNMVLDAVAFSPDGRFLAYAGNEKVIRFVAVPAVVE